MKEANETGTITAVMSSYNYIGGQWAGACAPLLNTVLMDEWGYEGFCLTDYFANFYYMDATRSIYNGGDTCLINVNQTTNYVTATDATTVNMRDAARHILYVTGNSRAHAEENLSAGMAPWQMTLIVADVIVVLALLAFEFFVVRKGYQKRKKPVRN